MIRSDIARASAVLMLGNLASRVLGVAREATVVGMFGLSAASSAFVTAATVPTMVYDLVIGGAISAAMVPLLAARADQPDTQRRVASGLLGLTLLVVGALAVAGFLAAEPIARVLGTPVGTPTFDLTVSLIRIVIPSVLFLGAAAIYQALLQARGVFRYTALSGGAFNAGIVVVGVTLGATLGPIALAIGLLVGAAAQSVVQAWPLRGNLLVPRWPFGDPDVGKVARLYAPVAVGLVFSQAGIILDRYLAWSTGAESIALMRSATTIVQLPLGLVGTALAVAVLPSLARSIDDRERFDETLGFGVRLAILTMAPATVGLIVLRDPLARFLFERGAFGPDDSRAVAEAFLWYAPQIPFWAVDQLLIAAYYARQRTVTPMLVGVAGTILFAVLALVLYRPFGVFGLIVSNTVQNSVHCLVMYALLWRDGHSPGRQRLAGAIARAIAASIGAAAVVALAFSIAPAPPDWWPNALWLAVVGTGAVVAAGSILIALRTPDLAGLTSRGARLFQR
ncbi:MAG: murein biosynthesis integral membrane protein MurJ [Chloroflexota bacterium]|nr:MAG: murein biosynthesis integral membrane protein MurJ [Chloroflexota bacterium]